jgi:alkylation response protein AidB-like acyl-CoA dehydrogenase
MRRDGSNAPVVLQALIPKDRVEILDTWHVGGLKGTGSTEFVVDDIMVDEDHVFTLWGGAPRHADPLYRLPPTFFGFGLAAVPLGVARAAVEGLKDLAARKKAAPPRLGLADQAYAQYVVAKAEASIEAGLISARDAFSRLWDGVKAGTGASLEDRARLRRACVNAAETSIEAAQMCHRAAGGHALFEREPFERALRDATAAVGHITLQRAMMEDAGRVALGLAPLLPIF